MRKESAKSSNASADTDRLEEEGFYRRWSSRKRRARRGEAEETAPAPPSEEAKPDQGDESAQSERVLTDEDMPPIESLNEDSDYSPFLSPGVSDSLRKLALRKMFLSSKYNFTDGLDDYDDDFTVFQKLGDIVTSDMRHQMEMQAQRAKEKLEEEARAAMDEAPSGEGAEIETAAAESAEGEAGGPEGANPAGGDLTAGESGSGRGNDDETRSG